SDAVLKTLDLTTPTPSAAGCSDDLVLEQHFNLDGKVVDQRKCTYNSAGQLTEGKDYTYSSTTEELRLSWRETIIYDNKDRVKKVTEYYSNSSGEERLDSETTTTYEESTGFVSKVVYK